jgi:hypothetical protein
MEKNLAVIESRMMGIGALAVSLCLIAFEAGEAQSRSLSGAGAMYLGVGASRVATGKLDDRLSANGYPTFGSGAAGLNAGAHLILPGGVTVGAEWHGLIIGDDEHNGRDVGVGGGYGTLGIGYVKELSPRVRLYPRLGIGGGGMGLWNERNEGGPNFDDVLADPQPVEDETRDPVLSTSSAVIDLGLGGEVLPGGWARGLMFGVRLGYLAAFNTDWQLRDQTVSGGPEANIGGPYIRATIGVGWRRSQR